MGGGEVIYYFKSKALKSTIYSSLPFSIQLELEV